MDKAIAAAAIERLEAERQRRIEEKVASGSAVRVPLCVVVGDPEQVAAEIESARARKPAELRKAGETREIIFDEPMVINTGVPRDADFGKDWAPLPPTKPYDRHDADDEPRAPAITRPSEAHEGEPYEGPHPIHVQVRCSDPDKGDPGEIAEGSFTVSSGGIVRVMNDQGQLLGTHVLQPMEDAAGVARRILREKKSPVQFWNPLPYTTH
jgi:hypothetical protein